MTPAIIESVEAQRLELEASLSRLRIALNHWRTWDAEYEGLKEELGSLDGSASPEELVRIADEFSGELLTAKEIHEIAGIDKQSVREPGYIIGLIEKRQDYVSQNISTIVKQIASKEAALDDLLDLEEPTEFPAGPALPISEIIEELDDDDNIISSKVHRPEEATAGLLETLRQAGAVSDDTNIQTTTPAPESHAKVAQKPKEPSPSATEPPQTLLAGRSSSSGPAAVKQEPIDGSRPLTESLIEGTFRPGDRVIELGDDDEILASGAILPKDESPEDARLRREMLQYHLNEVGNVVAEIDLLEGDTDDEFIDELADPDDMSVNSDISEEEDEHGRSLGRGVTSKYRQEMKELQERLQGPAMTNLGPDFDMNGTESYKPAEPAQTVTLPERKKPTLKPAASPPGPGAGAGTGKSVRFAEELDISPAPEVTRAQAQTRTDQPKTVTNTLADTVLERSTGTTATPPSAKPAKVSRFKQSRQSDPTPPPADAEIKPQPVLSATIPERESSKRPAQAPSELDEHDPELQRRQLAARYYELRNDMIRQQGGFRNPEDEIDDGQGPLMEEGADGRVRKVSRFKAARLNPNA